MAANRFDSRRAIIVGEVNNLSEAILRVATFENDSLKNALYLDFRNLITLRKSASATRVYDEQYVLNKERSIHSINSLIKHTNELAKIDRYHYAAVELLQSLIKVYQSVLLQHNAMQEKVPDTIIWLLVIFSILCSVLAGLSYPYDKKVNWLPVTFFILFCSLLIYVILDMDRPKRGFITTSNQYQLMNDL